VAEPDLEAAEGAATVAMLFSSGSSKAAPKKRPVPKKKPAPKKAAAPKRVVKPAPKRVVRKQGSGKGSGFVGSSKQAGPERFAKNLFSSDNWAVQAFNILKDLPKNNENKPKRADSNIR
jgi:septal ring-binding cell division protein DamX